MSRGGCHADGCTLQAETGIVQEMPYRQGEYSQWSGGCLEGEERWGKTLSLIIDKVKTGEIHGLARRSYIPLGS